MFFLAGYLARSASFLRRGLGTVVGTSGSGTGTGGGMGVGGGTGSEGLAFFLLGASSKANTRVGTYGLILHEFGTFLSLIARGGSKTRGLFFGATGVW